MQPTKRAARVAGLLYVLMGLPAPFSLIYVPGKLVVRGDAAATAGNVLAHETLFRAGVAGELYNSVALIVLAVVLYRLLAGVNGTLAVMMMILAVVGAGIGLVVLLNNVAALTLFRGGDYLAVFDEQRRDALGMFFLGLHRQGLAVAEIFWGLWLLPFGVLVFRSGFIPRVIGALLVVNCFAYVVASVTALFFPAYANAVFRLVTPALLGELWVILWLLIKGVSVRQPTPAAASRPDARAHA